MVTKLSIGVPDCLGIPAIAEAYGKHLPETFHWEIHAKPPGSEAELIERLVDCDYAMPFFEGMSLTGRVLENLPRLKAVSVAGPFAASVDRIAAARLGISVLDTPQAALQSVAEMTLLLMLSLARRLPALDRSVRAGAWENAYGSELHGKVLGLAGLGGVGGLVATMGSALGMKIHVVRSRRSSFPSTVEGIEFMEMRDVCASADFLSIHLREIGVGKPLIDAEMLSLMRPDAFLINTARSSLVDQDALFCALKAGKLAGAALDVHSEEPLGRESRWLQLSNVIVTPHCAWKTRESLHRFVEMALANLYTLIKRPTGSSLK